MSLLIGADALAARAGALAVPGAPLAALGESLRADAHAAARRPLAIPAEKALLSSDGGRCPEHGAPLAFDPFDAHAHRCPVDGAVWRGERHDRWWITWYQLWLAERAVHAATLAALGVDASLASFARQVLEEYSERYLAYPNRDNVLGPSRPFFSTYLESIWVLQLAIALDLLEAIGAAGSLGARVRDRLIEPSMALIASYDEGGSNRQVWNDAALLAGGTLLGESRLAQRAIASPTGVLAQLESGLLTDGTWYEGENYHLFAHRGLWYGVTMMERAGVPVPPPLGDRFAEGFATPLASALPDFTFPSRRDSQYAVSLRQWRFAESCELGVARRDDPRLLGALWMLYEGCDLPRGDTGRWRSTADSERNEAATALGRADLGWRSLLLARETLPRLAPVPARSALLAGQGLAVLRRDAGRTYLALDYGHSGGGHGHPDRLNLLLSRGADRWLDDMGTGSYVDPSLHWYRSTLAHNAPLVDGRSQAEADGTLRAYDERGGAGWVDAGVVLGEGADATRLRRSLVAMPDYAVDRLSWDCGHPVRIDLPLHLEGTARGATFEPHPLDGGPATTDGFAFVRGAEVAHALGGAAIVIDRRGMAAVFVIPAAPAELWRATGPGAPGQDERAFYLVRSRGATGAVTTLWNWDGAVTAARIDGDALVATLADGSTHTHRLGHDEWTIAFETRGARSSIALGGRVSAPARAEPRPPAPAAPPTRLRAAPAPPVAFTLGEQAYRASEDAWRDAGSPTAQVSLGVEHAALVVTVRVRKSPVIFRPPEAVDPRLDNEYPDINSDGVQLHIWTDAESRPMAWLAVPQIEPHDVRLHVADGARDDVPLVATWNRTADGYAMRLDVPLGALDAPDRTVAIQVVVNDMGPERERRRGQLVLSGGAGDRVYLRGDRESPSRALRFEIDG